MKITSILHPTDFTEGSKAALQYAKDLAKQHDATITLMYVIDKSVSTHGWYVPHISLDELYKDMEASAKKELERCCYEELRDVKGVEKVVLTGVPDDEIVKYAKSKDVDLIVMGTYSKSGMDFMFGSTTEKVLRKAHCTVMCVKVPPHKTS
jgi:nucleotide-binding universal stress UspA family protein